MTDYKLGRLHIPDERDGKFPMRAILPKTVPVIKSKTWVTGPILDQGHKPWCVAYSWQQWLLSSPIRTKNGPTVDIIYHDAQKVDEWPGEDYEGTSVRAGAKVLSSYGNVLSYYWANSVSDMIDFVTTTGTIVVGTTWHEDMFTPTRSGFITPTGEALGGHAYLIAGYSTSKKAFRIVNSWGREWGQNGRVWIKTSDFEKLLADDGEACAAIEQPIV